MFYISFGIIILGCSFSDKLLAKNGAENITNETEIIQSTHTDLPIITPTPGKYYAVTNHWYKSIELMRSWSESREYCNGLEGYLVTISSEKENKFVYEMNINSWIGLSDSEQEGQWEWVTGEPLDYTNWVEGEPNNCTSKCGNSSGEGEDYVVLNGTESSQWNDVPNIESTFVCEWGK